VVKPRRAGHRPGIGLPEREAEILVLPGVLAIAGGIIYFAEPAKSPPAFVPGHAAT